MRMIGENDMLGHVLNETSNELRNEVKKKNIHQREWQIKKALF